jgi:hypothetical protein
MTCSAVGPQVFVAKEAPVYSSALVTIVATFAAAIGVLMLWWIVLARRNKHNEAICDSPDYVKHQYVAADNLTDRQVHAFFGTRVNADLILIQAKSRVPLYYLKESGALVKSYIVL